METAIIYNGSESKSHHQVVFGMDSVAKGGDSTVEFIPLFLIGKNAPVTKGLGIGNAHINECSGAMQGKNIIQAHGDREVKIILGVKSYANPDAQSGHFTDLPLVVNGSEQPGAKCFHIDIIPLETRLGLYLKADAQQAGNE